jgi:phage-related tail protein
MYDIEIIEANKLIDDSKRDAAAINIKKQQAEQELNHQKARYNQITDLREIDRREIDALHLQIAENEAVKKYFNLFFQILNIFIILANSFISSSYR